MQAEGVTARELGPVKIRILEYVRDHEEAHPGESADLIDFLTKDCGLSLVEAVGHVQTLHSYGLVHDCSGLDGPSAFLADLGRAAVAKVRAHRVDRRERAAAARDQLLAYVYDLKHRKQDHPDPAAAAETPFGEFYGDTLSADEFRQAADYLETRGLLTVGQRNAADVPQFVDITADGEDCMNEYDGDVAEYLRAHRPQGGVHNTTNIRSMTAGNAGRVRQRRWKHHQSDHQQRHRPGRAPRLGLRPPPRARPVRHRGA